MLGACRMSPSSLIAMIARIYYECFLNSSARELQEGNFSTKYTNMYNNNKTNTMHILLPLPVACFAFRLVVGKEYCITGLEAN